MRYNPKSMFMLNRDMLKRDLFFVFGAAVLFDIYAAVRGGGRELTIGLIVTAAAAIALILFFVITLRKPRPEGVRFDKQYIPTPPTDLGSNGGTKTAGDTDSFSNILD